MAMSYIQKFSHMIRSLALFTLVIAALGCASQGDVQRLGPDTYLISSQVVFGPNKANNSRSKALRGAEEFCTKQGKQVLVDDYQSTGHAMSFTGDTSVRFKCLIQGDKDLKRPEYRQAPDIVIENRISQ